MRKKKTGCHRRKGARENLKPKTRSGEGGKFGGSFKEIEGQYI